MSKSIRERILKIEKDVRFLACNESTNGSGTNTPQVQADYTETDNTLPSFIENKPLPPRNYKTITPECNRHYRIK